MSKLVKKLHAIDKKVKRKIGLKFVHKIERGGRRLFRKVWANPIGRIVISAALIFVGGAALGQWSWTGQAAGAAAGTAGGGFSTATGAELAAGFNATAGTGVGSVLAPSAASSGSLMAAATAPTVVGTGSVLAPAATTAATAATTSGVSGIVQTITDAAKGFGTYAAKNKLLVGAGMMMAGQMLTPTEAEQQREMQKDYWKNMNVGGIDVGLTGGGNSSLLYRSTREPVYESGVLRRPPPREPFSAGRAPRQVADTGYAKGGLIGSRLTGTPEVEINRGGVST